jgi:CheY-specific phosphatase CheX
MNNQQLNCRYLMDKLVNRSIAFLNDELVIETIQIDYMLNSIQKIQLNYLTSLISVEGTVKVFVVFSYDESLFTEIFDRYTYGLSIAEAEREEAMIDSVGDIINIIVGNTLTDVKDINRPDTKITMSPPLVITAAKQIAYQRGSLFYKANLTTHFGNLDIYLISSTIGETDG